MMVVAGVVRHAAFGDRLRHHGPGTGGDHDLVGGELVAGICAQPIAAVGKRRPQAGVAGEHLHVRGGAPVVLAAQRDRIDATEHPRDDVIPPDPVDVRVDPVLR